MFGVSLGEFTIVLIVVLVVVGPTRLPVMLRTLGQWIGNARRFVTQVRAQTGIDDLLREEGLTGGIQELRSILHGDLVRPSYRSRSSPPGSDPYLDAMQFDVTREYPVEGPDALGAVPDDLDVSAESPKEPNPADLPP